MIFLYTPYILLLSYYYFYKKMLETFFSLSRFLAKWGWARELHLHPARARDPPRCCHPNADQLPGKIKSVNERSNTVQRWGVWSCLMCLFDVSFILVNLFCDWVRLLGVFFWIWFCSHICSTVDSLCSLSRCGSWRWSIFWPGWTPWCIPWSGSRPPLRHVVIHI